MIINGKALLIFDGNDRTFYNAAREWIGREIDPLDYHMVIKAVGRFSEFIREQQLVITSSEIMIVQFVNPQDAVLFRLAV